MRKARPDPVAPEAAERAGELTVGAPAPLQSAFQKGAQLLVGSVAASGAWWMNHGLEMGQGFRGDFVAAAFRLDRR